MLATREVRGRSYDVREVLRATLRQTMHVAAFLNFKALQVACERLLRREAERVLTAGSPPRSFRVEH